MIVLATVWVASAVLLAQDSGGCSLWVGATLASGQPVHAVAHVTDATGRTFDKQVGLAGAEFCDLGIKDARVVLTPISMSCSWSIAWDVRLKWGSTARLSVVVPGEVCEKRVSLMRDCSLLVRAIDEDGKNLPGAELTVTSPGTVRRTYVSDAFGRVLLPVLPYGAKVGMRFTATDHKPKSFSAMCHEEQVEMNVELVWAGRE